MDSELLENLLEKGVFTFSGARDTGGSLLIVTPATKVGELDNLSVDDLAAVFLKLVSLTTFVNSNSSSSGAENKTYQQWKQVVYLTDLRDASTLALRILVEVLESVEHKQRGTIRAAYLIKPHNKTKSHFLKKLLGVKTSKKRPRIPLFKIVLVKSTQELCDQVDISNLTLEFNGTFHYNHQAWMRFYKLAFKCVDECVLMLTHLPSVKDRVEILEEYDTDGQSVVQLQQLQQDLEEKYHLVTSNSGLSQCLDKTKQALFLLDHPSSDSQLLSLHPDLRSSIRARLRELFGELSSWSKDIEHSWKNTENKLLLALQIYKHRERAKEIERKIREHYQPLLREHPAVGRTLSQAELNRAHFTTSLYEPAKELLSQATEILEAVQKLKSTSTSETSSDVESMRVTRYPSISDISQCLTTSIQPFTAQLQQLQQVYVSIHVFYLLFEKALIWYKKALKFVPESLPRRCSQATVAVDVSQGDELLYMPAEWLGAVRHFLSRHPPPRSEHINRLDEAIPQLIDRNFKKQARSLALRLRLLQRLFTSSRLPSRLVFAVMEWRTELFKPLERYNSSPTYSAPRMPIAVSDPTQKQSLMKGHGAQELSRRLSESKRAQSMDELNNITTRNVSIKKPVRCSSRQQSRRNSGRLQRVKSVEFNFNSSSTEGSVLDYEKAVLKSQGKTLVEELPFRNLGKPKRPSSLYLQDKINHREILSDPSHPSVDFQKIAMSDNRQLNKPNISDKEERFVKLNWNSSLENQDFDKRDELDYKTPSADQSHTRTRNDDFAQAIENISNSSLQANEKLKLIHDLLALKNNVSNRSSFENREDIRENLNIPNKSMSLNRNISLQPKTSETQFLEKTPVETVMKMKKKLAQSLEDINNLGLCENEALPFPSHNQAFTDSKASRFISELKIEPVFNFPENRENTTNRGTYTLPSAKEHRYSQNFAPTKVNESNEFGTTIFESHRPTNQSKTRQAETRSIIPSSVDDLNLYKTKIFPSVDFVDSLKIDETELHKGPEYETNMQNAFTDTAQKNNPYTNNGDVQEKELLAYHKKVIPHLSDQTPQESFQSSESYQSFSPPLATSSTNRQVRSNLLNAVVNSGEDIKDSSCHRQLQIGERGNSFGFDEPFDTVASFDDFVDFKRLQTATEEETRAQDEVASSLRKTERILQEEENRLRNQLAHQNSDMSQGNGERGGSLDNGYASWSSKLVSGQNTSSEEWLRLSSSSSDESLEHVDYKLNADAQHQWMHLEDRVASHIQAEHVLDDEDLY